MRIARLLLLSLTVLASAAAFGQSAQIVAQVKLLNQSSRIPWTTLLTPSTNGLFRVSAYLVGSNNAKSGDWTLNLMWTDEVKRQSTPDFLEVPFTSLHSQGTETVRALANSQSTTR